MKSVRPSHILGGDAVHYLFPLSDGACPFLEVLQVAARSITHLGWGVDMVAADAAIITEEQAATLPGERWRAGLTGGTPLRVPVTGTLDALLEKHNAFLNRLGPDGFHPVPPLAAFRVVSFRRDRDPGGRPYAAFRLLQPETGKNQTYAATDPVKVAGMIRGAAGKAALDSGRPKDWVDEFVYGHHDGAESFPRFSYLPLPSIQPVVGVGRISRVLIAEPIGAGGNEVAWIKRLLAGHFANNEQGRHALLMSLPHDDNVLKQYVATSQTWTTVTPVALPGSDDGIVSKTNKLLVKMFDHAGYTPDSVEELEYHRVPFCRGAEDAKRYRPRAPHHLANCTMYHMRIRWKFPMPGPIALGAGRHCGLGVLAAIE
jgi:CRISPR-associated protein Csb2